MERSGTSSNLSSVPIDNTEHIDHDNVDDDVATATGINTTNTNTNTATTTTTTITTREHQIDLLLKGPIIELGKLLG